MAKTFRDLIIWQNAHTLTVEIYRLVGTFPRCEQFSLSDQVKRSSGSMGANIAESFGRKTVPDVRKFLSMAIAFLYETQNHLILARDLGYLSAEQFNQVDTQLTGLERGISSYSRKYKGFPSSS